MALQVTKYQWTFSFTHNLRSKGKILCYTFAKYCICYFWTITGWLLTSWTCLHLKPLGSVYHSTLRCITAASYSAQYCILYEVIRWVSLTGRHDRFLFKSSTVTCHHTSLPYWTGHYFTCFSDWLMLEVQRGNNEFGKTAFSNVAHIFGTFYTTHYYSTQTNRSIKTTHTYM